MRINSSKSKIIPFNFTRKFDFIPKFKYGSQDLEVTYKTKLLGVQCTSDGKWNEHISYLVKKASIRLYFIRRLKKLGASHQILKESYILFVRPILEMCAPLWTGALTKNQFLTDSLERVQKSFCKILFPYESYQCSLENLKLQNLHERRVSLAKKTAIKMSKNDKFKGFFQKVNKINTRSNRIFKEPKWRTLRYGFSAIPFFVRLLNGEGPKINSKK